MVFRDLEVMGLIYTRRGMGCFVKENVVNQCKRVCRNRINKRVYEVVQEAKAAGISKKDLQEVITKSLASDADIYGEVPKEIAKLAK